MSIQKSEKELQAKQGALDKLINEKTKLSEGLDALNKQRSAATRDLAAGDDGQQEVIFNLEGQIAPFLLRLEGIETLIAEAEAKVQTAKTALEAAKADYARDLAAFIKEREEQELEKILASAPARKQHLFNIYADICQELGQLQIDGFYPCDGRQLPEILDIVAKNVGENLRDTLKARRLRPLMVRGSNIELPIWSHFPLDPEIAEAFPGTGPVNGLAVAKAVRAKQIEGYEKEFESRNRD